MMEGQGQRIQFVTDPDTEFRIVVSEPGDDDGCRVGEPRELVCDACGESIRLTREPSAGVDDFPHAPDCSQRFTHFHWFFDVVGAGLEQQRRPASDDR